MFGYRKLYDVTFISMSRSSGISVLGSKHYLTRANPVRVRVLFPVGIPLCDVIPNNIMDSLIIYCVCVCWRNIQFVVSGV